MINYHPFLLHEEDGRVDKEHLMYPKGKTEMSKFKGIGDVWKMRVRKTEKKSERREKK